MIIIIKGSIAISFCEIHSGGEKEKFTNTVILYIAAICIPGDHVLLFLGKFVAVGRFYVSLLKWKD